MFNKNRFKKYSTNELENIKACFEKVLSRKELFYNGLCQWVGDSYQTYDKESRNIYRSVLDYIYDNIPLICFWYRYWGAGYFWRMGDITPRIKYLDGLMQEYNTIKGILRQSIPLLPEIEKAFDAGLSYLDTNIPIAEKQNYIENLKLAV